MEIEIQEKKKEKQGGMSIFQLKEKQLRVAAYVRVSTDMLDQQTSFKSQSLYYEDYIESNPNWKLVNIYRDEGISGTQVKRRPAFRRMIRDATDGKIDLILTKSISRFARNTLDTLKNVRWLRDHNVIVYFEEERLNTSSMQGELVLTILSSIAQQEIVNLSNHVQKGVKMRQQRGIGPGVYDCYGYNYDMKNKKLVINKKHAKVIKQIFNWYLEGYSFYGIADKLTKMNVETFSGETKWAASSISNILSNVKYIGDVQLGKYYTADPITHRMVKNRGERDMYYVKNHHEAIISRADFEMVKKIRNEKVKKYNNNTENYKKYVFAHAKRCGFCGASIKRKMYSNGSIAKWICRRSAEEFSCPESKFWDEKLFKKVFMDAVKVSKQKIKKSNKYPSIVNDGIEYVSNCFNEMKNIEFDEELFKKVIKYVFVGGFHNGKVDPYFIRIIFVNGKNQFINHNLQIDGAKLLEKSNFYKIFDFETDCLFQYYENDENNIKKRKWKTSIDVSVEFYTKNDEEDWLWN